MGAYHVVVLTSDPSSGVRVYLDGERVFEAAAALDIGSTGTPTRLGQQYRRADGSEYDEYFLGRIDTIEVFSGILSADEVGDRFAG